MTQYDVAIAYRIYPRVSKIPPVFPDDKYSLSLVCANSLKKSLGTLRAKIWVLLDACQPEYKEIFLKIFSEVDLEFIELPGIGNQATFNLQINILLEQKVSKYIYFAEDDYFYLSGKFTSMLSFLKESADVHFISPYDHADYYTLDLHKQSELIRVHDDSHWRTASSTCLTFITTQEVLSETQEIFRTYLKGNYDVSLWMAITKRKTFSPNRFFSYLLNEKFLFDVLKKTWKFSWPQLLFGKKYKLWVPIPSFSTHMESRYLAPSVEWKDLIEKACDERKRFLEDCL